MNNWFVIASGPEAVTTPSARLFFVVWWLLSVLVVINIFVALLVDSFARAQQEVEQVAVEDDNFKLQKRNVEPKFFAIAE